jgi:plastocyanin
MKTTLKTNIMKTALLMLLFFGVLSTNAQTTHNLNWFNGITPENASLTIETGDTVIWTWTSPNHTVESVAGSVEEPFTSGILGPIGSTYSHTFTVAGTNNYICGIHPSMMGTITVEDSSAGTTHNLNWFNGITPEEASLTIETGDTVIWTWTSPNHTVESVAGSVEEPFTSGFLGSIGSTFSHTFTVVGTNDYVCGVHPSMTGTITVEDSSAGTTHNLNWFNGITPEEASLTIETGDTVIWTWTSPNHTVESVAGSADETFTSGFLGPIGSTFSHTFTVVGTNDYVCGVHPSMTGTITVVEDNLSVLDNDLAHFSMGPNPTNSILTINLPVIVGSGQWIIHDMLGKQIMIQDFNETMKLDIDVSSLKQGLYLVSVKAGNKLQTQRFIKN